MPGWEDLTEKIRSIKGVNESVKKRIFQLIQERKALEVKNCLVVCKQYDLLPFVPYEDGNLPPGSKKRGNSF